MLADVEYGLIVYAPAFMFAGVGARRLLRMPPVTGAAAFLATTATLITGASYVWWGGTSAPARFLVAALPVLALATAAAWPVASAFSLAACVALLAVAAVTSLWVAIAYRGLYAANVPGGHDSIFDWANSLIDITTALPSLLRKGAQPHEEALVAAVWLACGLAIFVAGQLLTRIRPESVRVIASWSVIAWIWTSTVAAWWIRGSSIDPMRPDVSQLSLLHASPRPWLLTGWDATREFVPRASALERLEFAAGRTDGEFLLNAPMIPAGRYQILHDDPAAPSVVYSLELGRDAWPAYTWSRPEEAPTFVPALPLHSVRVIANVARPAGTERIRLRTLETFTGRELPRAERVTRYGELFVYSFDQATTVEPGRLWLRGERTTAVLISGVQDAGSPAVMLTLHAADSVLVQLRRGAWRAERSLDRSAIGQVVLPALAAMELLERPRGEVAGSERRSRERVARDRAAHY